MGTRLELHQILLDILGSDQVYYQPPEAHKMTYPAIVYTRYDLDDMKADGIKYVKNNAYQVTVIDLDPDSGVVEEIRGLEYSKFNRNYKADGLNHDVFIVYY